jgi:putative chitinase
VDYLKAYQEKLKLTPDGIIGPRTAKAMMADLDIADKLVFAHLMGQIAHESGLYKNARENLNYSEAGLLNIFKKYYTPALAKKHARQPSLIGNHVYANRMGNGDEASGDGYKYRGIFGLQLTGKSNIQAFIKYLGLPLDTDPDSLLSDSKNYFLAGKYWFYENNVDAICTSTSTDCITRVSRKVNLGTTNTTAIPNGLDDRKKQTLTMFRAVGLT